MEARIRGSVPDSGKRLKGTDLIFGSVALILPHKKGHKMSSYPEATENKLFFPYFYFQSKFRLLRAYSPCHDLPKWCY